MERGRAERVGRGERNVGGRYATDLQHITYYNEWTALNILSQRQFQGLWTIFHPWKYTRAQIPTAHGHRSTIFNWFMWHKAAHLFFSITLHYPDQRVARQARMWKQGCNLCLWARNLKGSVKSNTYMPTLDFTLLMLVIYNIVLTTNWSKLTIKRY